MDWKCHALHPSRDGVLHYDLIRWALAWSRRITYPMSLSMAGSLLSSSESLLGMACAYIASTYIDQGTTLRLADIIPAEPI